MPGGPVKLTSQVMLEKWLAARAICVRMRSWSGEHKHMLNRVSSLSRSSLFSIT